MLFLKQLLNFVTVTSHYTWKHSVASTVGWVTLHRSCASAEFAGTDAGRVVKLDGRKARTFDRHLADGTAALV